MRQTPISKLSKLKTAQRAELLKLWTATLGRPPQFRASRELLASARVQSDSIGRCNSRAG